jgi:hypothetical protein
MGRILNPMHNFVWRKVQATSREIDLQLRATHFNVPR